MANIYEIKRVFDDAVTAAGITVNDPNIVGTDDLSDDIRAWSSLDEIAPSEDQIGEHLTIDFNYNIEFARDVVSTAEVDVIARKTQAGDDWENIFKAIFNATGALSAQNVTFLDGTFRDITDKETQSYGNMTVRVQHKFEIC